MISNWHQTSLLTWKLSVGNWWQMWLMYDHILYLPPHTLTRSLPAGNARHEPRQASHLMFLLHFSLSVLRFFPSGAKLCLWAFNDVLRVGVDVQGSRFMTSSKNFFFTNIGGYCVLYGLSKQPVRFWSKYNCQRVPECAITLKGPLR